MSKFIFSLFFLLLSFSCKPVVNEVQVNPKKETTKLQGVDSKGSGLQVNISYTKDSLVLTQDGREIYRVNNVAFGSGGVKEKRRQGDNITPVGEFRIVDIRPSAKFKIFMELSYPNPNYGRRGHRLGLINNFQLQQILLSDRLKTVPPQNTKLGGHIGIHGVGRGDVWVHKRANWTAGCVALHNHEITKLSTLVRVGTPVNILR
jgi:murein L,D-transpeptidase YafK